MASIDDIGPVVLDRCDSVYRLPLPLDLRCEHAIGHDCEHRSGWMRWSDDNDHARRVPAGDTA